MADARIDPLVRSFERSLRAERKSERTIKTYYEALEQLSALLHERGRGLTDATTADIQDYIIDIIERRKPSTANNRFRSLHRFYAWLEDEDDIPHQTQRFVTARQAARWPGRPTVRSGDLSTVRTGSCGVRAGQA